MQNNQCKVRNSSVSMNEVSFTSKTLSCTTIIECLYTQNGTHKRKSVKKKVG